MGDRSDPLARLRAWLLMEFVLARSPGRRRDFLQRFGTLHAAVGAPLSEWRRFGLLRRSGGDDIFAAASQEGGSMDDPSEIEAETWIDGQMALAASRGVELLGLEDPRYPALLREIPDPPALLYALGDPSALARPAVAVVGARRATRYGLRVARDLSRALASAGVAVVSGGARGVDSAAHRGALESGGVTVAVMGSGLDVPYPAENKALFERIAGSGAVISEFPFGFAPQPRHFPVRNRNIAGLSLGVVVVEAAKGSGSLITAALAADCGREVFAVPGEITSRLSDEPNRLIQDGAKLVREAEDVLSELPSEALAAAGAPRSVEKFSDFGGPGALRAGGADRRILAALDPHKGATADDLAARLGLAAGDLLASLTDLELRGCVEQLPGGRFVRRS